MRQFAPTCHSAATGTSTSGLARRLPGIAHTRTSFPRPHAANRSVGLSPSDPFALLYTSGTTGKPKGAIRSHESLVVHAYITLVDFGFSRDDLGLLVMPMCHANSIFFMFAFASCGAACCVYDRRHLDPEHLLATLAGGRFTFTSLVPTHYIMMLGLPEPVKSSFDASSITKLLISSAPARRETKLALMEYFRNSRLYEAYGSTEMGWVTLLRPEEQLTRLGSIGRETTGTGRIKLLDADGSEVADGEPGEIYARTPYAFQGYWKMPEKTAEAFRGDYCTVGDIARRDSDGYLYLVDRKSNMIISGGENVYPSEVEQVLGTNAKIKDVAVIGVPDPKWGEATHAVVILHAGADSFGGGHPRLVPRQDRRLQAAEVGVVHQRKRHAQDSNRQDTPSGATRPLCRAGSHP